jgi:hypothetical protein
VTTLEINHGTILQIRLTPGGFDMCVTDCNRHMPPLLDTQGCNTTQQEMGLENLGKSICIQDTFGTADPQLDALLLRPFCFTKNIQEETMCAQPGVSVIHTRNRETAELTLQLA